MLGAGSWGAKQRKLAQEYCTKSRTNWLGGGGAKLKKKNPKLNILWRNFLHFTPQLQHYWLACGKRQRNEQKCCNKPGI